MDIQSSKIELAKLILSLESPEIIEKIRILLLNESAELWDTLSSSEKSEIEFGLQQLDEGKRISVEDVLKKIS